MSASPNKDYIGDSCYVDFDGFGIQMTTENGITAATNTIYLEPSVLDALDRYRRRMAELHGAENLKPK